MTLSFQRPARFQKTWQVWPAKTLNCQLRTIGPEIWYTSRCESRRPGVGVGWRFVGQVELHMGERQNATFGVHCNRIAESGGRKLPDSHRVARCRTISNTTR